MRDTQLPAEEVYNADAGGRRARGGTNGMEAVARQFCAGEDVLVVRNGWFVPLEPDYRKRRLTGNANSE